MTSLRVALRESLRGHHHPPVAREAPSSWKKRKRLYGADETTQTASSSSSGPKTQTEDDETQKKTVQRDEERDKLKREREAAQAAAQAAAESLIARDNETWAFDCACGERGLNFDDGSDMLQCSDCYRWAHDACVVARLRGHASHPRLGSLRRRRYSCHACSPSRYCSESEHLLIYARPSAKNKDDDDVPLASRLALATERRESFNNVEEEEACRGQEPRPLAFLLKKKKKNARYKMMSKGLRVPKGVKLAVRVDPSRRDETVVREVCERGVYERPTFAFEIASGERWLDVGAHIGAFSAYALAAGASVVAVEPCPENFGLLRANGRAHAAAARGVRFDAIRAAVVAPETMISAQNTRHDRKKQVSLYKHPKGTAFRHSAHASRAECSDWTPVSVPATTLPDLLRQYAPIDGVKVDIQGCERDVLRSVRDWREISKLCFEYDFEYAPRMDAFHAFIRDLKRHFPCVYHPKLRRDGNFEGFPNGVLVFCLRGDRACRDLPHVEACCMEEEEVRRGHCDVGGGGGGGVW